MSVGVKTRASVETDGIHIPHLRVHRFTVHQYHRMIETGVLGEQDNVELLEGWIVDKMPQHPTHAGTISVLLRMLSSLLPRGWIVRVQSPVTLSDSEPEPDLAVVRGPEERYFSAHPTGSDIALVIEVADVSLEHDRTVKRQAYAKAGIPTYWIVNLVELTVEVYSQPKSGRPPRYQKSVALGLEYGVDLVIGGRNRGSIPVRRLFP
jgi:Uma2 family endonuclease